MRNIEVKVLNPDAVKNAEMMMIAMARLTQRGHEISNMQDFENLLSKPYTKELVDTMVDLPHPTIQKFGVINVAIVGASRRFLAQITRHQNEVKFMSGSLQYSDYSGAAQFVVPYEILKADEVSNSAICCITDNWHQKHYFKSCEQSLKSYEDLVKEVGRDAAGYAMPQGLRNVLLISATPYQWKHMIRQRTCNRNTLETQYVMLCIWEQLFKLSPMFRQCGPYCTYLEEPNCPEGKMQCHKPYHCNMSPTRILNTKFKLIRR